jgi:hypothetical protein
MRPIRCLLGRHDWTPWEACKPPCTDWKYVSHHNRRCSRCNLRDSRFGLRCLCPTDPNEYMHCPRWNAGSFPCRPMEN